jgi:hypothetical protein
MAQVSASGSRLKRSQREMRACRWPSSPFSTLSHQDMLAAAPPTAQVPATLEASAILVPASTQTLTLCPRSTRFAQGPVLPSQPTPTAVTYAPLSEDETAALTRDAMTVGEWINSLDIEGVCLTTGSCRSQCASRAMRRHSATASARRCRSWNCSMEQRRVCIQRLEPRWSKIATMLLT